ncbi:MAG TPA: hypothetical protein VLB84_01050 [Bacteroidia bacterium]|nr:hypothetical protein [Bacteroidia bacterium]
MKAIKELYKPFDLSSTRCYVAVFTIDTPDGYHVLEHKLPSYVQRLKGIFITVNDTVNPPSLPEGFVSLNFNGQTLRIFRQTVYSTFFSENTSRPFPFNEELVPNSYMQGYYQDYLSEKTMPYQLRVYLHYEPITTIS